MSNRFTKAAFLDGQNQTKSFNHLLACIKQSTAEQQSELADFLDQLPPLDREQLFVQLATIINETDCWWFTVIKFFPEPGQPFAVEKLPHYQQLILSLLRSPTLTDRDSTNRLSLLLSNKQLALLVNEQRLQKKASYDHLLLALTIRAMLNPAQYQYLIHGHKDLANELMVKRLQKQPKKHHVLIEELLTHADQFNWKDDPFLQYITDCITRLFINLTPAELKPLFKKYFAIRGRFSNEISRLLDAIIEHQGDIQLIAECIADADSIVDIDDKESQTFCYYYLINSNVKNLDLIKTLLNQLSIDNLIKTGPHIVAARQLREPGQQSFTTLYAAILFEKLKSASSPGCYLKELADIFACLEDNKTAINALFDAFSPLPTLRHTWFLALIKADIDKKSLFERLASLPKTDPAKRIELLKALNADEFCQFYLYMLTQHSDEDFSIFSQVIIDRGQQDKLILLLTTSPQIKFVIEDSHFDDETLIKLLQMLCHNVIEDNCYEATLSHLSLLFCYRLSIAKHNIHQHVHYDKLSQTGHYLLSNPSCFTVLCQRSTVLQNNLPGILQNRLVRGAGDDLKLRIIKLFNELALCDAQIKNCAIRLLAHYQKQSGVLQTLFINLYEAESTLNEQGAANFKGLQQNCWAILMPESAFDNEQCKQLLTTQLKTPGRFSPLLATLATIHAADSKLGAEYLAQTQVKRLETIDEKSLVAILLHSIEPATFQNWQKISETLGSRAPQKNIDFVKELLAVMIKNPNNPQLNQHVWNFLICLKNFKSILLSLENEELIWLIQHCEKTQQETYFLSWITKLTHAKRFPPLSIAALCLALPDDEELLLPFYLNDALAPFLHTLFIELALSSVNNAHLLALQIAINEQDHLKKRQFIEMAQQKLLVDTLNSNTVSLLMMLFHSLPALQSDNRHDVRLVFNQLAFLQAANTSAERLQFLINLFNHLNNSDSRWANVILSSADFAQLIPHLLPEDRHIIRYHQFSTLLRQHAASSFHSDLLHDCAWQDYLECLLSNPPEAMTEDEFALLFSKLNPDKQYQLAQHRLGSSIIDSKHKSTLYTLTTVLSIDDLYTLSQQGRSPELFVELIIQHRQGIQALPANQRNNLLQLIINEEQLWILLSNQSSTEAKISLVSALLEYLTDTQQSLTNWFNLLKISGKVLAAIANHCTNPKQQPQLDEALLQTRKDSLQHYLYNPLPNSHLIKKGLLYRYVKAALTNADSAWQCAADFYQQLTANDQMAALQHRFKFISALHHLESFFTPFDKTDINPEKLYSGARWLQLLPLMNDLPDKSFENRQAFLREACNRSAKNSESAFYFLHNKALGFCAVPELNDLFSSQSEHSEGFDGKLPLINVNKKDHLIDALSYQQNALKAKNYSFKEALNKLLTNVMESMSCHKDRGFAAWFVRHVLLSPIGHYIEDSLTYFLTQLPVDFLSQIIAECYKKQRKFDQCYLILQPLKSITHAVNVVHSLRDLKSETLIEMQAITRQAQLPYLNFLIQITRFCQQKFFNEQQINQLLMAQHYGQEHAVSWIGQEITQLRHFTSAYPQRCLHLAEKVLFCQPDKNNWQRLAILSQDFFLPQQKDFLVPCLNSYAAFLNDEDDLSRIQPLITQLLTQEDIIQSVSHEFYTILLLQLLRDVEFQQESIEQLLKSRSNKITTTLLKETLKSFLHQLFPINEGEPPESMSDLSPENLITLSSEQLKKLLFLQSFCFYMQPVNELEIWQRECPHDEKESRALFSQEASLYLTCYNLARDTQIASLNEQDCNTAKIRLKECLQFIHDYSKKFQYLGMLQNFNPADHPPQVNYHRLTLLTFLSKSSDAILYGFIEWLNAVDLDEISVYLLQILHYLLDHDLLTDLCAILIKEPLESNKSEWLCDEIFKSQMVTPQLIKTIVTICSWPWLIKQLRQQLPLREKLLCAALECDFHCNTLTASSAAMDAFLQLLKESCFPLNELIKMLQTNNNPKIKNLIALHLMSRQDYLTQQHQESFLNQISQQTRPYKKRLQPLLNLLDLQQLSPENLLNLQPESAASILCSLRHLHQINDNVLEILLQKVTVQQKQMIVYWLNHYADKPNAEKALLLLAQNHYPKLIESLPKCEPSQRQFIIYFLLKNLPQISHFKPADLLPWEEKQLTYVLQLFLESPVQDKTTWSDFIELFLSNLPKKHAKLDKNTLHLLIRLSETPSFKTHALLKETLGSNLMENEQFLDDCSLFYDEDQFQITRALKKLPHHEIKAKNGVMEKVYSLVEWVPPKLSNYLHWVPEQIEKNTGLISYLRKNTVLQNIAGNFAIIPIFNYFLIHFSDRGPLPELEHCLQDYLSYFAQENIPADHLELLHSTAWLINQDTIKPRTRNAIFASFFKFPSLIDAHIAQQLLQYNAQKTLQFLGRGLNYKEFIKLCKEIKPLVVASAVTLKPLKEVILLQLKRAKAEAAFELSLSQSSGWLLDFRLRVRRCLFYDWTGWFKPKSPEFVHCFETNTSSTVQALGKLTQIRLFTSHLPDLLTKLNHNAGLTEFKALSQALKRHNRLTTDESDFSLRQQVDAYYQMMLDQSTSDAPLRIWLRVNDDVFIDNRYRLAGLYWKMGQSAALSKILGQIGDTSVLTQAYKDNSPVEFVNEVIEVSTTRLGTVVQKASHLFGNTMASFWNLRPTNAIGSSIQYLFGNPTQ